MSGPDSVGTLSSHNLLEGFSHHSSCDQKATDHKGYAHADRYTVAMRLHECLTALPRKYRRFGKECTDVA